MDRTGARRSEPGAAMRADGDLAIGAVLQTGGRERREDGADAFAGRAVHAHALLWGAACDVLAVERLWRSVKYEEVVCYPDFRNWCTEAVLSGLVSAKASQRSSPQMWLVGGGKGKRNQPRCHRQSRWRLRGK